MLCGHMSVDAGQVCKQMLTTSPPFSLKFRRRCWDLFGFDKKGKGLQITFQIPSLFNSLRFRVIKVSFDSLISHFMGARFLAWHPARL